MDIMSGVGTVVKAAVIGMDWLKKAEKATLLSSNEKPLSYRTRLGFPFIQQYYKPTTKRVKMFIDDVDIKIRMQSFTRQINKTKSNSAIAPNFIHSQDATHLLKTALLANERGMTSFSFIHDSFGVHAADTEAFRDVIRESFVWLYEEDTLGQVKAQWGKQFPDAEIPEPPYGEYGTLDLQECLKSSYIFN